MPIDLVNRRRLAGTGLSPAHVSEFLDLIDEVIGTVNASGSFETDRFRIITDVSQFPAAVGGERQLADSTLYLVIGVLDLDDTYLRGGSGTSIIGFSPGPCTLTNSRNDYLIRGSIGVRNIQLICPNGTAYHADQASTAFLGNVVITGSNVAAEIVDCSRLIIDRLFSGGNGRSIVISGNVPSGQILKAQGGFGAQANFRGVEIEATATVGPLTIKDCQWTLSDATHAAFEFADGATYPTTSLIRVQNNNLVLSNGAAAIAGSIDKTDPRFEFRDNTDIVDSAFVGSIGFTGNASEQTTITTQGAFVPIGQGNASHPRYTLAAISERFSQQGSSAATDVLRHEGLVAAPFVATYSVTAERVGGGSDEVLTRLTVHGTPVDGSDGSAESSSGASSITRSVPMELSEDDDVQIEIANGTDTSNFVVRSARLTILRAH